MVAVKQRSASPRRAPYNTAPDPAENTSASVEARLSAEREEFYRRLQAHAAHAATVPPPSTPLLQTPTGQTRAMAPQQLAAPLQMNAPENYYMTVGAMPMICRACELEPRMMGTEFCSVDCMTVFQQMRAMVDVSQRHQHAAPEIPPRPDTNTINAAFQQRFDPPSLAPPAPPEPKLYTSSGQLMFTGPPAAPPTPVEAMVPPTHLPAASSTDHPRLAPSVLGSPIAQLPAEVMQLLATAN